MSWWETRERWREGACFTLLPGILGDHPPFSRFERAFSLLLPQAHLAWRAALPAAPEPRDHVSLVCPADAAALAAGGDGKRALDAAKRLKEARDKLRPYRLTEAKLLEGVLAAIGGGEVRGAVGAVVSVSLIIFCPSRFGPVVRVPLNATRTYNNNRQKNSPALPRAASSRRCPTRRAAASRSLTCRPTTRARGCAAAGAAGAIALSLSRSSCQPPSAVA